VRGRRLVPAVVSLALVAAVSGCGSSGPSREEFAKRADALCAQANRSAPQKPPKTAKEAVRFTQQQIAGRTALDAKLRKLSVPDGERSDFSAYNARTATMIGILREQNAAARRSDESGYDRLQYRFATVAAQREKLAIKLGFGVCGRGTTGGSKK
jgi:hypothetical protein